MSNRPERIEKDCLNCGAEVAGRFCQVCGQENIVLKQTAVGMIKHFIYDIFHFDGKFFDTLRGLFFKPGYVPRQYIAGKRMSFLDPIRMYLFTSAVFFLIFFSMNQLKFDESDDWEGRLNRQERMSLIYELKASQSRTDSVFRQNAIELLMDSNYQIRLKKPEKSNKDSIVQFHGKAYGFSARRQIPENKKEDKESGWLSKVFQKTVKKYEDDPKQGFAKLLDTFLHRLPYMLLISLPLFALILKLVYIRRKQFYYSDHVVFTLYHYVFSFMVLLVLLGLSRLDEKLGWSIIGWIIFVLNLYWLYHLYKSMRRFYEQSRGKTIVKFLLVNLLGLMLIGILFTIFLVITAYQI